MTVVTRFAPSPTGFLHIGGARTALFNYLFAKHHGGRYLLRIEDTDRQRSTQKAIDAILDGLSWLGLSSEEEIVYQSRNADRHAEVAHRLLADGKAYRCYCSTEELEEMRARARAEGRPPRYDGRWRDRDPGEAPAGVAPVIRVRMPRTGETTINDLVQGSVTVGNDQLDDFILLRADGTPTYMLSVVVDDHDMGITHVIRGDDHLTNAFRQYHLYKACGWSVPEFAHIPLIHNPKGAKLSKRDGAIGVDAYRDEMGYLPEALFNYLLKLGWAHGEDEVISREQAIEWFDIDAVGRAAARFDFAKLENLNGIYMRQADDMRLADLVFNWIYDNRGEHLTATGRNRILKGMPGLKTRAKTIRELSENALFYEFDPVLPFVSPMAEDILIGKNKGIEQLKTAFSVLFDLEEPWTEEALQAAFDRLTAATGLGLAKFAQPLRAALTGSHSAPGVFEILAVLGREDSLQRIVNTMGAYSSASENAA